MKKSLLIKVIVVILSLLLVGCEQEKDRQEQEQTGEENAQQDDDKYLTDRVMTSENYIKAIKKLQNWEIPEDLISTIQLKQLKVDQDFVIVWTEDSIPDTKLPIVVVFNGENTPIYAQTFHERIESIRYVGQSLFDKRLIEVISYGASGSFSGQWVTLLKLEQDSVENIWTYQTINNASRFNREREFIEYLHDYSTYLIIPEYQQRFCGQGGPKIIVHDTSEVIHVSGEDDVLFRESHTKQRWFIWNEQQQRFIEEESSS